MQLADVTPFKTLELTSMMESEFRKKLVHIQRWSVGAQTETALEELNQLEESLCSLSDNFREKKERIWENRLQIMSREQCSASEYLRCILAGLDGEAPDATRRLETVKISLGVLDQAIRAGR